MPHLKTLQVADALSVPYYRLYELLRLRKIPAPQKDGSGDYAWTDEDIERARSALARRRRGETVPESACTGVCR